jgi:hypothetical protein
MEATVPAAPAARKNNRRFNFADFINIPLHLPGDLPSAGLRILASSSDDAPK